MIGSLSEPLGAQGQPVPSDSTILMTIPSLTQLLEDCSSSSTTIKKMLHSNLKPSIDRSLELLPYLIRYHNVCEVVLNFLHSVFLVLQQQLGPEFTQTAVQGMLQIYTRYIYMICFKFNKIMKINTCVHTKYIYIFSIYI